MQRDRFAVLDGLRGVAALVVLLFHLVQQSTLTALPYAGLAVDFFYVLSGFVVAFAYEKRLTTGEMTFGGFFAIRLKRLYPLIFLGTSAGIALALIAAYAKETVTIAEICKAGILGLLLLPSFAIPRWPTAYPFNMASWSLTFEVFANVLYACVVKWMNNLILVGLAAVSSLGLIWLVTQNGGIAGGNNQVGWAYGFVRVLYPFFVGVLIFRFRPRVRENTPASLCLLGALLVALTSAWPWYAFASTVYVMLLFPALVYMGAALKVGPRISEPCAVLGALSYPIYILQGPVLRVGEEALKHVNLSGLSLVAFNFGEGVAVVAVAWLALKFYDEPIQRSVRGPFAKTNPRSLGERPESAGLPRLQGGRPLDV